MNKLEPKPFQDCCWIGPDWQWDSGGEENRYYALRKSVSLPARPVRAPVRVTADARYILWVNGRFVGRGPARCFPWHQAYDVYNLAPFLKKGLNWVAVLVHQIGRSTGQYIYRYRTGLLMDGEVRCEEGTRTHLRTDLSWQVRFADWFQRTHARISQHLGFQERLVGAREPKDWRCPSDSKAATEDRAWRKPFYVGPPGCAPWTGFEPRELAPMVEEVIEPERITWGAVGKNPANVDTADNVCDIWYAAQRTPLKKLAQPDRNGWMAVNPKRGFTALAFDFGWNHAAYARIEVRNCDGQTIIDHYYSPALQQETNEPWLGRGFEGPYEGMADRFLPAKGNSEWESFSIRGYRQHIVVVRGRRPVRVRITARRTHHAVKPRGRFRCNDAIITSIWPVTDRTLRAGMLDAFVDNNYREQAQWLHDGCVIGLGAWATYGDTALWRRGLKQWSQSSIQYPSGCLNGMTPMECSFTGIPDYSFAWMASLVEYYRISGDTTLLAECLEPLRRLTAGLIAPNMTREGLFIQPEGHWLFLDWSNFDMSPYSLVTNLMLLRGLESGQFVATVCRDRSLANRCGQLARTIQRQIERKFWSERHGAWIENVTPGKAVQQEFDRRIERQLTCPWNRGWPAEQPPHPCSRQANALGVLLGLGTARQQARASDFVARSMTPEEITRNPLSHLWIDKVLGAMFLTGHDREAVQVLRSSYGAWAAKGATTWSELWDADATTHAQTYGGAVNWVLTAYLLGVRPSKPGFAEVIFDPRPGDLEQVEGTVPTPKGDIHVSWKQVRPGMLESEIRAPRDVKIIRNKEFS